MSERQCCVCERTEDNLKPTNPLLKCYNPNCNNYVCKRHALWFEIDDQLDAYCSRQCWNETRQRRVPVESDLLIAAIVLVIAFALYGYVVSYFL